MKSYSSARIYIATLNIAGWLTCIVGVAAFLFSLSHSVMYAFTIGATIIALGFSAVVASQFAGAQIDTAENTALIYGLLRKSASDSAKANQSTTRPQGTSRMYRGVEIVETPTGFIAMGKHYFGAMAAEQAIDRMLDGKNGP